VRDCFWHDAALFRHLQELRALTHLTCVARLRSCVGGAPGVPGARGSLGLCVAACMHAHACGACLQGRERQAPR
jgi:hypothetical protein